MKTGWVKWWKDKTFVSIWGYMFIAFVLSLVTALCLPNVYGLIIIIVICACFGVPTRKLIIKKILELHEVDEDIINEITQKDQKR